MATDFKLPDLGENIASGDVVSVFVSAGDVVKPGQALLEVETDKGHDAFLLDEPVMRDALNGFLDAAGTARGL